VSWFRKNPGDTRLDNHDLKKKMFGQRAFSITDDIRIVYKWLGKNEVRFLAIGGHSKVYK
jgi:mRNA-degrading endonuclease YafQ of YafQ-DinJ toxin-antitoxin module